MQRERRHRGWFGAAAAYAGACLAVLGLLTSACENTVEPFVDDAVQRYFVSGFLGTERDTQFVRIEPIRRSIEPGPAEALDVRVTTTLLATGEAIVWRDSLVRLEGGGTGHLYWAAFTPAPGGVYRLDVHGPEGLATRAVTRVPPEPAFRVEPPRRGTFGGIAQDVHWSVEELPQAVMRYRVRHVDSTDARLVELPYGQAGVRTRDGWRIEVQLERDRRIVLDRLDRPFDDTLTVLEGLGMSIERLSPEWIDPEAELNITDGRGFFGAASRYEKAWELDSTTIAEIGYLVPPPDGAADP